jgi:hypothetical protein
VGWKRKIKGWEEGDRMCRKRKIKGWEERDRICRKKR